MNETEVSETTQGTKKELGRKFFVFIVWVLLVVAVAVLVALQRLTDTTFEKVIDNFYIVSIVYIGGNVAQKIGKNVASAISKETEGEK